MHLINYSHSLTTTWTTLIRIAPIDAILLSQLIIGESYTVGGFILQSERIPLISIRYKNSPTDEEFEETLRKNYSHNIQQSRVSHRGELGSGAWLAIAPDAGCRLAGFTYTRFSHAILTQS